MGLLTFSINVTLDGCVDHQEGIADDETHAFFTRLMDEAGAMLWGRVTYEMMESYWPAVARGEVEAPPAMREWAVKLEAMPKHLAHARQFLPKPAQQTAQITLLPVVLQGQFEEPAHTLERGLALVSEASVKARVHMSHILVDDLEREVLFVLEVMIEGTFRRRRGVEQRLHAEIVVAVLQEHGHSYIEQALLG